MSIIRIAIAILFMHSAIQAEESRVISGGLMASQVTGVAVTAATPLQDSILPEHKRTFVLTLGIVALAITFQQALANRKTTR